MLSIFFHKDASLIFRIIIPILFSSLSIQYLHVTLYQGALNKKSVIIHYALLSFSFLYLFILIGVDYSRFPVGNFSEALLLAMFLITISTGLLEWLLKDRSFSFMILPFETIISIITVILLDSSKSLPPALQSFHWPIHIAFTVCSYVLFFIAFISALSYILKYHEIKRRLNFFLVSKLPSLEKIDRYMTWSSMAGLISLTLGMALGMSWMFSVNIPMDSREKAELSGKIAAAIIIWLTFLFYLILKKKWNLHGKKGAYIIFTGFFLIILAFSLGDHGF